MKKMTKHQITLTDKEIYILAHLTRHFCDYMAGDDRPDHGMGILKQYREMWKKHSQERKSFLEPLPLPLAHLTSAMGKLNRMERKIRIRKMNENEG